MATRFYFRESGTAPITPSVDGGWESSASPFARKPMFTTTDGSDTLTTVTGFTSTTGQDRCHRQLISQPMAAGAVFDTSATYKCYVQGLESALNDNIKSRLGVRILSEDGSTIRHTVLAIADYSTATEWNTALRNKAFANGDAGTGSYTTVAGDRLVVEIGHNDTAGASISASSRWGSAGSADLGENETSTSTTERPWFETSLNLTFIQTLTGVGIATAEAFGTGVITTGEVALTGVSIASAEAFGTGTVAGAGGDQDLTGIAIASGEAFGTGAVTPGEVALTGVAITSAEAFGTGAVTTGPVALTGVSIASAEAFGTGTVAPGEVALTGVAIASAEAFGTGAVTTGPVALTGVGIASAETFGTGVVSQGAVDQNLTGVGIATSEAFGAGGVAPGEVVLTGTGIASAEAFGVGALTYAQFLIGIGIVGAEAFGVGLLEGGEVAVVNGPHHFASTFALAPAPTCREPHGMLDTPTSTLEIR